MTTPTLNILLLEDDEVLATALNKGMIKRGHSCIWCKTIDEFKQRIQVQTHSFDLILMDLKLENESSLSSIQTARNYFPQSTIFMITGFASIATTVEAIKQGADDYLPKPISCDDILVRFFNLSGAPSNGEVIVNDERLSPKRLEWEHIQQVLQENDGNVSKTAIALKMHRRTLQRKLQKNPTIR